MGRDDAVDIETVWKIVKRDLPPLITFLETVAPRDNEK